jgi:signal transduction histidine kinase
VDWTFQIMSHEVRTPLNAVVASAELLGTSDLNHTQVRLRLLRFELSCSRSWCFWSAQVKTQLLRRFIMHAATACSFAGQPWRLD